MFLNSNYIVFVYTMPDHYYILRNPGVKVLSLIFHYQKKNPWA